MKEIDGVKYYGSMKEKEVGYLHGTWAMAGLLIVLSLILLSGYHA